MLANWRVGGGHFPAAPGLGDYLFTVDQQLTDIAVLPGPGSTGSRVQAVGETAVATSQPPKQVR